MHVSGMTINGVPPFTEKIEFAFDEQVNLFIGPNGAGKSTALRMLQARTTLGERFDFQLSEDGQQASLTPWPAVGTRYQNVTNRSPEPARKEHSDMAPWVYVPAVRVSLPFSNDKDAMQRLQSAVPAYMYDSGEEIPAISPIVAARNALSQYYFDGSIIQKYSKTITDLFRMQRIGANEVARHKSAKETAYKCIQSICSDILTSSDSPSDYIYDQYVGRGATITNILDDMGIAPTGSGNDLIFAGDLSAGTQATLLWVWYMAIEMANFYSNRGNWSDMPAVLLIDEIENHLHPTWQRRVIPALLEHFPGLQIFATTHSPFVVAGLKAGQVHILQRDADSGVITASTNTEDIVGWTMDEILRAFMGVADPTDDATAAAARDLRQLRDAGPSADEGEEASRQARMLELRRLVDRDLLAGGPKARRREEFAQQFAEALEKRRQAQSLNQDGADHALG